MGARRILITGVSNYFGARLAARLVTHPDVDRVVGLDTRPPEADLAQRITFVQADVRSTELGVLLRGAAVDTIVHNDIVQFPEPDRARAQMHDVNVIGTLQLLAAAETLPSLRHVVVRGSAAIYGAEPGAPAFFTEALAGAGKSKVALRTRFQRDIGELETLFETFAHRHRDVVCTVLRMQPVVGTELDTPINRLFLTPVIVRFLGFDPRVQILHEDDAVGALEAAVHRPVRGAVNVAADGVVSLDRVLRRLGRRSLPVAPPLFGAAAGLAARLGGGPPLSDDVARYLRYGRGVDTTRMHEELAFTPRYSTLEAIEAVARSARGANGNEAAA